MKRVLKARGERPELRVIRFIEAPLDLPAQMVPRVIKAPLDLPVPKVTRVIKAPLVPLELPAQQDPPAPNTISILLRSSNRSIGKLTRVITAALRGSWYGTSRNISPGNHR